MDVVLFLIFLFSLFTVYFSIFLGQKIKIIDNPSSEKIHKAPIPRTGGIGIFFTFLLGIILFPKSLTSYEVIFVICIFIIGFVDDIFSIRQSIKFVVEIILTAILSMVNPFRFTGIYPLDVTFSTFYIVGAMNALNVIDGMDGLAGGVVIITCLFLSNFLGNLPLIIAIACIGFLFFNFHPAKVFMGDSGSLFLGAVIGILSLKVLNNNPSLSTLVFLIFIYSIPIYDTAIAIIRRTRKSLFSPDLKHFYNVLYDKSKKYVQTVLLIYLVSIILGFVGLFLYSMQNYLAVLIGAVIWLGLIGLGYKLGFIKEQYGKDTSVGA